MIDALLKKRVNDAKNTLLMGIANVCYNALYMGYMLKQRRKKEVIFKRDTWNVPPPPKPDIIRCTKKSAPAR